MAIPVLFELNQELTRLFAAGSRLSADDPRLKKFVAPLKKYGEKSPVFLKLAEHVEDLLAVDASQSAQKLIEAETFLLSVLSTQGNTAPSMDDTLSNISFAENDDQLAATTIGYRTLSPVIKALTSTGSGRMEIIKQAFESGAFKDPRLYKIAVDALGDKYSEIADYMENTVLPSIGDRIYTFLIDGYNPKGGAVDGRRILVMHKIKRLEMLHMVDEAIENGNAAVKTEAVKIMSEYPKYEETLLNMLGESKSVREEVMKALVKLDSKAGVDKIMETYKSGKHDTVIAALSHGSGEYLSAELLKAAQSDYEEIKKITDALYSTSGTADDAATLKIQKLKDDINALKNKSDTAHFLQTMLSEDYLAKAESVLPKDKKQHGYYYYRSLEECALEALYFSGKGNDFIWEMFEQTQDGLLNKILKIKKSKKKKIPHTLYCYAFQIGAVRLSAEEFYNIFFKTHLYRNISKQDYYIFERIFLQGENPLPFSKKIARYLVENMNDYNNIALSARIVSSDDHDTLNLLAERVKNNLTKNVYGHVNYEILKRLGETNHRDFKELYELYYSKNHGNALEKAYLEQFLSK